MINFIQNMAPKYADVLHAVIMKLQRAEFKI